MNKEKITIYDTTLRDGAQAQGIDFSVADKQAIAAALDAFGVDYIEGGWPGANPTDDKFFEAPGKFKHATFTAFGRTRKAETSAANDPILNVLINTGAPAVCIVGKSWDFHVKTALGVSLKKNLEMIGDSIAHLAKKREALFDAEHFFDSYKANPEYALEVVTTAYEAGARWVILCDTNGGTQPHEVEKIVETVIKKIPGNRLGIHAHNDTGNAVANSIIAVQAGVRQVQGTINGIGERCGNADLCTVIPNLMLKLGYKTNIPKEHLQKLTGLSRMMNERINRPNNIYAPYVGAAAFAHKGGLHVSAVAKDPKTYEHIDPAQVGNQRVVVVSDQAGRANIIAKLRSTDLHMDWEKSANKEKLNALIEDIKGREMRGYSYDGADASFEILARRHFAKVPEFYALESFRVQTERRFNAKGKLITISEAVLKLKVEGKSKLTVSEGNGPVNAMDKALRKALVKSYPKLKQMQLVDYKVRILTPEQGTEAVTRVLIESADAKGNRWSTVGVSSNVIDASYNALQDSITYFLMN